MLGSNNSTINSDTISVMLVDDSAVIRGALKRLIVGEDDISVIETASDGSKAIEKVKDLTPDIIILDIEMPIMDGLTALPQILQASPNSKVIMFSSLTEQGASVTLEALRLGAVECIVKPSSSQDVGIGSDFQRRLISLIRNLAPRKKAISKEVSETAKPSLISGPFTLNKDPLTYSGKPSIIAIGSSTGGPQALFNVLKHCKGLDIPIIITQHMPATFTKMLAKHITQHSGIEAFEAEDNMIVKAGHAYVAPGGFHMKFALQDGKLTVKLDDGPVVNFCKPAVDVMYDSIIDVYGKKVLGVILTGMGHDGLEGGKKLIAQKGRLIAQDEKTSVVWGMPGAVAQAGLCQEVLPLDNIGPWIRKATGF